MTKKMTKTPNVLFSGILILCIALGITGCNDDLLTTVPQDRVSSATFWSNERDFNTALNGAYERMVGVDLNPMYFDGTTDIGYSHADWMRQHEYVMGRANALSGWSAGIWSRSFTGISRANEILAQLDEVGGDVLSGEAADRIRGEALFLRGYFYHELLWMFGEVPLFTSVPTVEEARSVSRSSREEVYDRITSDLTEAANLLRPRSGLASSEYGRATSGAAMAYHARTALYEAGWQEHHEGNASRASTLYGTARDMAEAIMNSGEYELHPDFRQLFTYAGEQSQEIIFDYQKVAGQNGWWAWLGFAPKSMGSNVDVEPTRELVDRFPMEDGQPIDESPMYDPTPPEITYDGDGNPNVQTMGMYADRDPRFYGTVLFPGQEFNGVTYNSYPPCSGEGSPAPNGYCSQSIDRILISDYNNTYTGYVAMKYVDPQDESSPSNSGLNIIKMRYADVLLMYAEAKAELGELDQSANDAIQEIRDRVNLPMPQDVTSMNQQEAIDFIRNERVIELAWEGLHLADIRRWKTAEDVLNGNVHGIDISDGNGGFDPVPGQHTRSFEAPRDYLWPIPSGERDLNPNLSQNPGY
ncbi:RagB/SusD family nutrient uptake outer membrane protein [Aliifodinibius sp. S!AR15-10]|uniref:RagB/SusD family nutrient uptake outer membrane protein n=1 Tax=Aliifodinibius sp. S!AR15-10 TaxID=2950437 RepID=UPI002856F37C|nr:RagB/SusD family nutrient uptake outer membrane protein [Aliifodinibius sp. S!AR15-10]MDR8392939.1 RagB/SusD family nutrient uptake outer membrane protein [Aliifodinibius sp. S!AR15-10]